MGFRKRVEDVPADIMSALRQVAGALRAPVRVQHASATSRHSEGARYLLPPPTPGPPARWHNPSFQHRADPNENESPTPDIVERELKMCLADAMSALRQVAGAGPSTTRVRNQPALGERRLPVERRSARIKPAQAQRLPRASTKRVEPPSPRERFPRSQNPSSAAPTPSATRPEPTPATRVPTPFAPNGETLPPPNPQAK